MQKTKIFDKNLEALKAAGIHQNLYKKLKKFKQNKKYDVILNKDPLDVNIMEIKTRRKLYESPKKELEEKIEFIKKNKAKYPILFFYGVGNGFLYKALLQNENYKKIVVFEKDAELLFIVLNLVDLSKDLNDNRLYLILNKEMNFGTAISFFYNLGDFSLFYRTYFLEIHCDYYERQKKDILNINGFNHAAILDLTLRKGNDPADAAQGVDQLIQNLPKMLTRYSLNELIEKRAKKAQTAIIVATGPSLNKQLPLLKKHAQKASIFCLDASYPILAKEGIKPDYVLSLERVVKTSEFFDNDFGDFDKNILFIFLALTHPKTIEFIERNKRDYMLIPRYLPLAYSLKLSEFGFGNGFSVTHLAYSLALSLGHKNVILIGQDLAFGKNGETHSKDYPRGLNQAKQEVGPAFKEVEAYGGEGKVQTTHIWDIFRTFYEQMISFSKNEATVYNATEGGARIKGTIEKPFAECCAELLDKNLRRPLPRLKIFPREKQNELMLSSYQKLKSFMSLSDSLGKECRRLSNQIKSITQNKKNRKHSLEDICKNIDKFRAKINQGRYYYLAEILGPSTFHAESLLAPLYLQDVKNESDKQNKLLSWIYANEAWIDEIHNLIYLQNGIIKRAIVPLRELLEKRKIL